MKKSTTARSTICASGFLTCSKKAANIQAGSNKPAENAPSPAIKNIQRTAKGDAFGHMPKISPLAFII
ncbi:MAG: hypothetical protein AAFZ15_16390 [Bacteroidota bacterium]